MALKNVKERVKRRLSGIFLFNIIASFWVAYQLSNFNIISNLVSELKQGLF